MHASKEGRDKTLSGKYLCFHKFSGTLKMSFNSPLRVTRLKAGYTEVLSSKSRDGRTAKNRKGEMPPTVPEFTETLRPRIQLPSTTGHLLFTRETTSLHGQKHSHLGSGCKEVLQSRH